MARTTRASGGRPAPLTLADSRAGDVDARLWEGVPAGTYRLEAVLPPGVVGYAVRAGGREAFVRPAADGTGYDVVVDAGLFRAGEYRGVGLDVYLLRAEG